MARATSGDALPSAAKGWSERGWAAPAHRPPPPSVSLVECRLQARRQGMAPQMQDERGSARWRGCA
eukprot:5296310-Amphidinium_carterae.1